MVPEDRSIAVRIPQVPELESLEQLRRLERLMDSFGLRNRISGVGEQSIEVYGYMDKPVEKDKIRARISETFQAQEFEIGRVGVVGEVEDGEFKGTPITESIY